jgi:hypothetical protein
MTCVGRLLVVVVLLLRLFGLKGLHALTAGSGPSPRFGMGFESTPDGVLYVFGGTVDYGSSGKGGRGAAAVDGAKVTLNVHAIYMYIYICICICIYILCVHSYLRHWV